MTSAHNFRIRTTSAVIAGGASALTPAEIREVRLQAESEFQDELREKPKKGKKGQQRSNAAATTGAEEPLFGVGGIVGKLPKSAEILRYKVGQSGFDAYNSRHFRSPLH